MLKYSEIARQASATRLIFAEPLWDQHYWFGFTALITVRVKAKMTCLQLLRKWSRFEPLRTMFRKVNRRTFTVSVLPCTAQVSNSDVTRFDLKLQLSYPWLLPRLKALFSSSQVKHLGQFNSILLSSSSAKSGWSFWAGDIGQGSACLVCEFNPSIIKQQ